MKRIKQVLMVLPVMLMVYTTEAQSLKTYQFISEADDYALTFDEGELSFIEKKSGVNMYNQLFILKKIEGSNEVLICPVSDAALFLKREGDIVVLASIPNTGVLNEFQWSINYAGHPFLTISVPQEEMKAIGRYENQNNPILANAVRLENNEDGESRLFRLKIVNSTNTF